MIAVVRWALSFLLLAGIVLVYRLWLHVNSTTVALTLLLFILAVAATWTIQLAITLSLVATLCYNFYFLPPFGTLTIADPQNWTALLAFISTAVIGSRLSLRARKDAADARLREREMETLFQLSQQLLRTEDASHLLSEAPTVIVSATGASSCLLYLLDEDQIFRAGSNRNTAFDPPYLRQRTELAKGVLTEEDTVEVPLYIGVKPRGLLLLTGTHLSTDAAEAMGGLISLSIDRVKALEHVAHNEAARESERLRTLMIDSITHELRTPLTSIKGAATTLLSEPSLDHASRDELLTIVDEETDRIDRLVEQAAEMAKLDARQVQMHIEKIRLADLLASALEACSWVRTEHPLITKVDENIFIDVDHEYMKRVLCNLLENAARYSAKGTEIRVQAESSSSSVSIHVSDKGTGIEPHEQSLIFDRFYRAPQHTQRIPGTGMGLSISKAIVERHGGTLTLVSQPGYGTVFTIILPNPTNKSN